MEWFIPLAIILPMIFGKKGTGSKSSGGGYDFPYVKEVKNVPFGIGTSSPYWPLITKHKRGLEVPYLGKDGKYIGNAARSFGASRDNGNRYHVGIDLYCYAGDLVVACESGKIVNIQKFLGPTYAILIQGNSGLVCLYGEVENGSWKEFGLKEGSSVKAGQPIARVGVNNAGTYMLHFETYIKGTTKNYPWYGGNAVPPELRNPTKYLLQASKRVKS